MADAAEVYRARPTDAEIDEVLSQRAVATVGTPGCSLMVSFEGAARVIRGPAAQALNHRLRAKYIKPGARTARSG